MHPIQIANAQFRSGLPDESGFLCDRMDRKFAYAIFGIALSVGDNFCPSNSSSPAFGVTSCNIIRAVVVFPQPDSPTSASVLPLRISNDTSLTTRASAAGLANHPDARGA